MRFLSRSLLFVFVTASLAACGGTSTSDAGTGGEDGGSDEDAGGETAECGPAAGDCAFNVDGSCGSRETCGLIGSSDTSWMTMCIPAGEALEGTECNPDDGFNECAPGLICSNDERRCRAYCCGDLDCELGQFCLPIAGAEGAGQCRSSSDCDPVFPQTPGENGCEDGQGCYVLGDGPTCLAAGDTTDGGGCEAANACAPGLICVGAVDATCARICDTRDNTDASGANPTCEDGQVCGGITGIANFGACG